MAVNFLTIFQYDCEHKTNFIYFLPLPWLTDGNFSCENHLRCFWQFSCVALNFFDNFPVWPWPYKFISKKFDNFPVWFFDNFPVWIFDNFPVWVFDNFPVPRQMSCFPRLRYLHRYQLCRNKVQIWNFSNTSFTKLFAIWNPQ